MDHKAANIHKDRIYYKGIKSASESGLIPTSDSILVVCGGHNDKKTLEVHGYQNVTISNLDDRLEANEFAPYSYSFQDAEDLSFEDQSFDWVLVHAGLHHCYRPHRALLEMLRVSRKGAIVFEARDSFTLRLAKKFDLVPTYEIPAVIDNDFKYGGVANTSIPNYIYRWKEREIESILDTYYPTFSDNKVHYFYSLRLPTQRIAFIKSPIKRAITKLAMIPIKIFCILFPKHSNEFGFVMTKGSKLQDWLKKNGGVVDIDVEKLKKDFDTEKRL